ncbi:UNKNOWN [Stylonychia lemnae]|uniref:Leucine rich repeat family protein n=1 Tax=Stylonychia lemnae TaxID=5949 RepID=A0A078AZZ3_STYLE|nr:UNKNOWN [Stylonychia lemnae]|eukprot:CDW87985.1 UNKNOWN [Stylonychia lemnae]
MSSVQNQLEEQKKIIEYLASKYEKDTGRRIQMPSTLGQLLGDDSIVGDDKKSTEPDNLKIPQTFGEAVEFLRLPKGEAPKKGERKKKELTVQPHHMLEKIDLSGFRHKRFSRSGMKELIEGLQLLPCIRTLCLRNNGITDECDREILEIFSIVKIRCIDLSKNNMVKLGGMIGKKLKDEVTHIQWIDLTQNDFFNDNPGNSLIVQGLKKQANLVYVGLTVQGSLSDQLAKMILPKKPAFNLNMRNSTLTKGAADHISKAVSNNDYYLTSLSLKFCFISFEQLIELSNSLRFNKTLVKLDLSSNALKSCQVKFLLDSMMDNVCLTELNLASNFLDDEFAQDLSYVLENNPVLYKVDISRNPIGPAGAQIILNALLVSNETLGSLGGDIDSDSGQGYLDQNVYMGVRIREELRQVLILNNSSHDKKRIHMKELQEHTKKTFQQEKNGDDPTVKMPQKKIYDIPATQQAKYPLLKPVTFTNPQEDDYLNSLTWCLK